MKTKEKRSDWYLTKRVSIIFVLLLILDFSLLKIFGEPYKGGYSIWMSIYKVTSLLLILSLACLATVAFYETARHFLRKENKEDENSA